MDQVTTNEVSDVVKVVTDVEPTKSSVGILVSAGIGAVTVVAGAGYGIYLGIKKLKEMKANKADDSYDDEFEDDEQ